ncbi:hypothetical protein [Geodermatophilus ruber]|uniref:O-antigen ligase like membrane protein n=1 Tax=Geodermatophilus ruber TaxID=504800 RepID=A0A1I4LCM5_9ACTN|nr:hypothetical protein [Geodermatophilus ruber]SFL88377.1 hypothetical protein SAMN04488085_12111 [Geodermatophilus ruber]
MTARTLVLPWSAGRKASAQAAAAVPRPWPRAVVEPTVLVAAGAAGLVVAYQPLLVLGACAVTGLAALVWVRPATAAYLLVGVTPLVVGIDRGVVLPLLRPHEGLLAVFGATLAARWLIRLRSGQVQRLRMDAVEVAILLMAVTNSVLPLAMMVVRGREISGDDLSYSLVMWKLAAFYLIVRGSVRSDREVRTCLIVSVAAACIVAVIGILQGLDLFGVRGFLAVYYSEVGVSSEARGGSTLTLPAATADLMILNLAIVTGLWLRDRRFTALSSAAAGLFVFGTLAAGQFASILGLVVGMVALALVTARFALLGVFGLFAAGGAVVVWPVIAVRLEGFSLASGLPESWLARLHNLHAYFWPELFSHGNVLLGVRPSARVPAPTQFSGWVWIESGYTWLLWGGGIPLLAGFVFLVYAAAARTWAVARSRDDAVGAAATAAFVGVVVVTVLMVFDPHVTYRGSAEELFALLALTAVVGRRRSRSTDRPPDVARREERSRGRDRRGQMAGV